MRPKAKLLTLGLLLSAGASVFATSVDFTFDTQTINGTVITGLASGATAAQIQTYMNSVLSAAGCAGCTATVLVSGSTINAVADQTYNASGAVTGPGTGTKSLTLGDSNGVTSSTTTSTLDSSYDTFIANTNDSSSQIAQQITIQFKNVAGLTINSFDYEVFPDGSCRALTPASCGGTGDPNQPDLKFEAGTNTTGTDATVTTLYGVTPGTTDGNAVKAPASGTELAPQAIGTWSGSLTGDTELDFVDWPATIGVDDLSISFTPSSPVPEPASVVLLGTLVVLLATKLRKSRATAL